MGLLYKLQLAKNRGAIAQVIYRSELSAPKMGTTSMEIIRHYANELKSNPFVYKELNRIVKLLQAGKEKEVAYRGILDEDILIFLKESRINSIPSEAIFKDYVPLKEIAVKTESSIRKKLYVPFVIFALLVFGLNTTMRNFLEISEYGIVSFSQMQIFLMKHFIGLNLGFLAFLAFFLIVIPSKTPLIKKVFAKIKSMLVLSSIKTMTEVGYRSGDILRSLSKQLGKKIKRKGYKDEVSALIDFLMTNNIVNLLQGAELKMGASRGEVINAVDIILDEKKAEVADIKEMVDSIIGTIAMLLMVPPVFMVVSVLATLISSGGNFGQH